MGQGWSWARKQGSADDHAAAAAQGWTFVDAMAGVRTPDGQFWPGATADGVHPTPDAAAIIGKAIADAIQGCCAPSQ